MSLENGQANIDGNNRLLPGDYCNIAGVNSPEPVHVPINGESFDDNTPEKEMISKERWETVKEIILQNPDLCEDLDLVMDHFAGYSWGDLGQRYNMTRDTARGRVIKCIEYLKKQIIGKQF